MKNKSLINLIILLFLIIAVVVVIRNQKSNSTDAFRKNQSSHFVNTGKQKAIFSATPKI
jgi:preprotein translocase subunit SecG